jgi:hypothetical protein
MARQLKNFKIELNSTENLRDLLQCIMELAGEQVNQAQDEINKLKTATALNEEAMDGKSKYAKAINDFLTTKNKAASQYIDVAKMLQEVIKYNGDLKAASEDKGGALDISSLQAMVDKAMTNQSKSDEVKVVNLKKQ